VSIESLARDAATDLRSSASGAVDVDAVLDWLEPASRRRTRRAVLAGMLVAAVVAGVVFVAVRPSAPTAQPGHGSTTGSGCPAPIAGLQPIARGEQLAGFTCLGGRTFRADLSVPLTFELPPTFAANLAFGHGDAYQIALNRLRAGTPDERTFVLVSERVRSVLLPIAYRGGQRDVADPAAGTTSRSLARWLSMRPFVTDATVTATTLAGLPAYRVDLTGGGSLEVGDIPVLANGPDGVDSWLAVRAGAHVRVWLFDLPGRGLAAVWSQTIRDVADLDVNDAVVQSIRFDG
jgi:hypothetical protein